MMNPKTHAMLPVAVICLLALNYIQAQPVRDSTLNNLVHPAGYKTGKFGELGNIQKTGSGKQTLILIPGWGFDGSVFDDFREAYENQYTIYTITIPGYGNTAAPPMPPESTSYGAQSWNNGVIQGLVKLIEKEKIRKPIIVGHFTQGAQVALRLAAEYPDKVGGVITLGGQAKFISVRGGEVKDLPLATMITFTDKFTGPQWFKMMVRKYFDDNNYPPALYSLDSLKGAELWRQSAAVPFQVMVRYICEFFASDIKTELHKIQCPVLILRPTFSDSFLKLPVNAYVKPQFIDSWNDVSARNPLIKVKDIKNSACFVWKDNPADTYREIKTFVEAIK
ncbi:MAG: alpha/beta hydrolase [Ignavibacteriales bacterium]|nr:alpha/beta hydrolase [Ignavibacteriales bacterium]